MIIQSSMRPSCAVSNVAILILAESHVVRLRRFEVDGFV